MSAPATGEGGACIAPALASRHTMTPPGKLSPAPCAERNSALKNSSGGNIALILARMLARRGGKSRQKPSGKLASTGEFPAPGSTPGRGNLKQIAMQRYGCWNPRMGRKSRPGISNYMIDRYGEEEGKRVYGLLTCAAVRFRKCGHGSGAGWRVLAVPALPEE